MFWADGFCKGCTVINDLNVYMLTLYSLWDEQFDVTYYNLI